MNNFSSLPENIGFDEFKSVKNSAGSMSFIFIDNDSKDTIDIVEDRRIHTLREYFSKYPIELREKVKTITIDIYTPYIVLIEEMFPNAKIILDRFHIVQNLLRALNKLRIDTMNKYGTKSFEYKRFKRYWKLLLKSRWKLDSGYFAKRIHFKKWQSEKSMVDKILELNDEFKASYHCTNELLYYLDTNDYDKFVHTLNQEIELPKLIKTVIETTKLHIDKIQNTMNYQYTNGPIEGIIGKIKLIKRVAYGYRNFYSLKTRVNLSMLGSKLKKQEKIRVKKLKEQYTA